jgi:hypothetical protein
MKPDKESIYDLANLFKEAWGRKIENHEKVLQKCVSEISSFPIMRQELFFSILRELQIPITVGAFRRMVKEEGKKAKEGNCHGKQN